MNPTLIRSRFSLEGDEGVRVTSFRQAPLAFDAYEATGATQGLIVLGNSLVYDPATLPAFLGSVVSAQNLLIALPPGFYRIALAATGLASTLRAPVPPGAAPAAYVSGLSHTGDVSHTSGSARVHQADRDPASSSTVPDNHSRLPVGNVAGLRRFPTVSAAASDAVEAAERIAFIRENFSLNISQLADVLGVTRPTVYSWLKETPATPRPSQLVRVKRVYDVAREWNRISREPLPARLLAAPLAGSESFLELLTSDGTAEDQLREGLRTLRAAMKEQAQNEETDSRPFVSAAQFARERGYTRGDEGSQQVRRDSGIRRGEWDR